MKDLTYQVAGHLVTLDSIPSGNEGTLRYRAPNGQWLSFSYKRDADGIWLELPAQTVGFDFEGERDDSGKILYRVTERLSDGRWNGVSVVRPGEEILQAGAASQKKGARIRAQMPGKILKILVKPQDRVEKGQSLIVMEAMKMENEIKAPISGVLSTLSVQEGAAVETGTELARIES